MPAPHHSIFTGRMLFLTPNQKCQSTESKIKQYGQENENNKNVHTEFSIKLTSSQFSEQYQVYLYLIHNA